MDYPSDFPKHLQHSVDAAIHKAEQVFVKQKDILMRKRLYLDQADHVAYNFINPIFFAFANQASRASEEGAWTGQRVRHAIEQYLRDLIRSTWKEKHPNHHHDYEYKDFSASVQRSIKESETWIELQAELARVAERRSNAAVTNKESSTPARVGNQPKARSHNEPKPSLLANLETVNKARAAEALGVSIRTIDRYVADKLLIPTGDYARRRFKTKDLLKFMSNKKLDK